MRRSTHERQVAALRETIDELHAKHRKAVEELSGSIKLRDGHIIELSKERNKLASELRFSRERDDKHAFWWATQKPIPLPIDIPGKPGRRDV